MLSAENIIRAIEEMGYCRIPNAVDPSVVSEALTRVRNDYDQFKDHVSPNVPFLNVGQPTLYNLQNKDMFYLDLLFNQPEIEKVLMHFLNDQWFKQIPADQPNYILRSYIARSSNTQMPLHIDSFAPYLGDHVFVMQYSLILEDQSPENGCTVVVPKSHICGEYATQDQFKNAVPIESNAGDIVMWDSRLWHGTTANNSKGTRWAIISTFCRWWMKQHWNVPEGLPQEFYDTLSDKKKAVLGFCSISHRDEMAGIDLKCGYDGLPSSVANHQ